MKKVLTCIIAAVVILIILGIIFGKDESKSTSNQSGQTQAASTTDKNTATDKKASSTENEEAIIKVTPDELMKAYKANEVAANKKYKDKKLSINGKIESIEAGLGDEPYLTLKAGGEFELAMPQAHLANSESDKAAELKKGQQIHLICIGNSEVAGVPMLDDCVIQ
ncbi:hypothetical protein BGI15_00390 [Snodgrassella alvi]|uniref:OB-fold protein n=1 Tax=Snodgrassella alvi TaxID=1196083 RepID=UPI000A02D95B|nr:hypothetical protein [Snodgrassella alvi]ORF02335.1 hypothetical protein BGH97_05065 [Snodgrassella alvi]ORF09636.1 hypothetical protein BGH99_01685 [Snodgrassella alvi]ORF15468.1 hypothetical protein BGI00_00585 [Snodgrassella alvi]ORF16064.1 hypothetical protein BGI02_01510 [Snodgrassella alvi]ORF22923.1 hypothetical protein BGI05_00580 [Snodgrassella alvi]